MDEWRYYCAAADRANYEKVLNEVISAEDSEPNLRLSNAIAKRQAKRALTKQKMDDCGFAPPSK